MYTSVRLAIQHAGHGRMEGHARGNADNCRFESRFVIFALSLRDDPLFGRDVSLFSDLAVSKHGRGAPSAHFVAVRSGWILESFSIGERHDASRLIARTSSESRLRIYFDPNPDGSRTFSDRSSFMKGELIATYQAEEYLQIDQVAGNFETRVNYALLESTPFKFAGVCVDMADFACNLAEASHGSGSEPDPEPEEIPLEEPFARHGEGLFVNRFMLGGTMFAAG